MTYSSISIFNKEPWSSYKEAYGRGQKRIIKGFLLWVLVLSFIFYVSHKIVCKCKGKYERFFFSCETHKKYCNWFENSEINLSLFRGFSLQGERVFYVNICIFVCDCYLELIILEIILFGTQQNQIWNCKDTFIFLLLQFSCWFCFTISYVLMGNNNYRPILDSLGVC